MWLCVPVALIVWAPVRASGDEPAKTGDFEWSLTAHSPNSNAAEMCRRFGYKPDEVTDIYSISDPHLFVYVPADYNAAAPPGLFVLLNDQPVAPPSSELKTLLDESHLIFVAPQDSNIGTANRAALLLDIVENLQKAYSLDKRRIYFACTEEDHFLPFAVTDVYTGYISLAKFILYGKVLKLGTRGWFEPHDPAVPSKSMQALAHRRGFVFLTDPELAANDTWGKVYRRSLAARMGQEGYAHVQLIDVAKGENQYPNFATDWFKRAIRFLDSVQGPAAGTSAAGGAPATQGAAPAGSADGSTSDQAARLLKLGKLYMDAGRKDAARAKLKELIAKYPDDPAAATAKKLLSQMDSQ